MFYIILATAVVYVLVCKAWPYFLYPNYFREAKVERYPMLIQVASSLEKVDKFQTVKNVYAYMRQTYGGDGQVFSIGSLLSIFWFGDFSTESLLNTNVFLWCHTQNRLMASLLLNTGLFAESDIVVRKRYLRSFFVHQWLSVRCDDKVVTVDPYYGRFKSEHV